MESLPVDSQESIQEEVQDLYETLFNRPSVRRGERSRSRPAGPYLVKRRKITSVNPWKGYIISYLEQRRLNRPLEIVDVFGYEPTALDVERILLAAAPFVQTFDAQIEEFCSDAPSNQKL